MSMVTHGELGEANFGFLCGGGLLPLNSTTLATGGTAPGDTGSTAAGGH